MRTRLFLFIIFCMLLAASCKKDLLHLQQAQQLNSNTTATLNNIRFLNDSICIAAGGETFYSSQVVRSADGGYTWMPYSSPDAPKEMYGMDIAPDGRIFLSGIDGDVLHSSDMGISWQFAHIDNWLVYKGGTFPSHDTGFFVSSVLQRESSITRVDANFKIIDQQTYPFGLNRIYMVSPSTGYAIGYGAMMKTVNNGASWQFQSVDGDNFTAMDIHGSEIWLCGAAGGIFHTTDGGDHWARLRNGNDIALPRYMLRDIKFKDAQHGWAVGDKGKAIYTQDGGAHWAEYTSFTTAALRSIALCPNGDVLVAGDGGTIFRLTPYQ